MLTVLASDSTQSSSPAGPIPSDKYTIQVSVYVFVGLHKFTEWCGALNDDFDDSQHTDTQKDKQRRNTSVYNP